jgi:hypothetical protein
MKKYIVIFMTILLASSCYFYGGNIYPGNYGDDTGEFIVKNSLGETYSIKSYSNGEVKFASHENNYNSSTNFNYGMKWQCVEYVNRFYYDVFGINVSGGNGNTYFTRLIDESKFVVNNNGKLNKNGEPNKKPKVGDILCFSTPEPFGHVGIIREVTDDEVIMVNQNFSNTSNDNSIIYKYKFENNLYTIIEKSMKIQGWIHYINNNLIDDSNNVTPKINISPKSLETYDYFVDVSLSCTDTNAVIKYFRDNAVTPILEYEYTSPIRVYGNTRIAGVIYKNNVIVDSTGFQSYKFLARKPIVMVYENKKGSVDIIWNDIDPNTAIDKPYNVSYRVFWGFDGINYINNSYSTFDTKYKIIYPVDFINGAKLYIKVKAQITTSGAVSESDNLIIDIIN